MSATRTTAGDRLRRLLAIVPWVAAADGPTVEEVCARFGLTQKELMADLDVMFLVGIHPFTPDELIEASIDDGRVWIRYADLFSQPLQLTPDQALAMVAASQTILAVEGADADGPMSRGIRKLGAVLGISPEEAVEIRLSSTSTDLLDRLGRAVKDHTQVEIDYYSYGRDSHSVRIVEPHRVHSDQGSWYLTAYCHQAEDVRNFRVDRIAELTALPTTFEPVEGEGDVGGVFHPSPDDPRVVLALDERALWVAEQYPNEGIVELEDGRLQVTLAVSEVAWLERLLVRLGPNAEVVRADTPLDAGIAAATAERILRRYHGPV